MKILFVLENYHPRIGGVETLFKSLVDRLSAAGHHCVIITTHPGGPVPRREHHPGQTIIRVPVWSRYLFTLWALFPIMVQVRRCDLVHTTSYNAALPAFIGARLFGRKVIITFHEAWGRLWFQLPFMGKAAQWGHYLFEQMLLRLPFHRFVAVSGSTAEALRREGVDPERIAVIYNGIDYQAFSPDGPREEHPEGQFVYTYFGRLGISKGLDIILPAAAEISRRLPESRLQLIIPPDPPPFFHWIRQYVHDHGLGDHVCIRHHLSFETLKAALRGSGCVIIPSYSEGFCFAAVESMALGVPVVSSGRAALREVIGGRFVEMENLSAAALAEAVTRMATGQWEEKPVKEFRLEETIRAYLELYEGLAEAGRLTKN